MNAAIQTLKNSPLFQRTKNLETPKEIFFWWEKRRIFYNLVVGSIGCLTCIITFCIAAYSQKRFGEAIGLPDPPIIGVLGVFLYGLAANLCYTGGWFFELIARVIWKERAQHLGEIAFRLGVFFSVALTFLPSIIFLTVLIVKLFSAHT